MTALKIWSAKEIDHYEMPPLFNGMERKKFFTLPANLKKQVDTFRKIENRVGFYLMFGYFKTRRRFFPQNISVSRILGLPARSLVTCLKRVSLVVISLKRIIDTVKLYWNILVIPNFGLPGIPI